MTEIKYDKHAKEWQECLEGGALDELAQTWLDKTVTLNTVRQRRVNDLLRPFIEVDAEAAWLTVGDGRYGLDGMALQEMGASKVHCSDMDATLLKIAHERNLISHYSEENAEKLSFPDDSFDYVLCKESYHHFPRPYVALNELMRVCRKGVLLIEPRDRKIDKGQFSFLVELINRLFGLNIFDSSHGFEPVGNYAYCISQREMEKFQLGMHRQHIALCGVNDYYQPGYEFVKVDDRSISNKLKIFKFWLVIAIKGLAERLLITKSGLLIAVLFKVDPGHVLKEQLRRKGYRVMVLPKNPYI